MRIVSIDSLDPPTSTSPADVLPLSDQLGTTHVAINYFELAPGDQFGFDLHRHLDQEEVFYIIKGTATFESESSTTEVRAGEAIRFEPGEFQLGRNCGDDRVVALALGAPRETTEIEYFRECETCDRRTIQPLNRIGSRSIRLRCQECGSVTEELSL